MNSVLSDWKNIIALGAVLGVLLSIPANAEAKLAITNVTAKPNYIDLDLQQETQIRFRINQASTIAIKLFDANHALVRQHAFAQILKPGEYEWHWDGKNNQGEEVKPEVYFYTLHGQLENGEELIYDLTDITGGNPVSATNVHYVKEKGVVNYALNVPARIFLRAQLSHGLLLDTLVNSKVHAAGLHSIQWDGKDSSGNTDIANLGNLSFTGRGYQLPRNAIIVNHADLLQTSKTNNSSIIRNQQQRAKSTNEHYRHDRELCKDFTVILKQDEQADSDDQIKKFRVDLMPSEKNMVVSQRFEVSFFIDYKLAHENEVSYVPYNWRIDTSNLEQGEHVLTAVVIAYGSHVGSSSLKFKKH